MTQFYMPQMPLQALTHLKSAFDVFQLSLLNQRQALNAEKTKCMVSSTSTSD